MLTIINKPPRRRRFRVWDLEWKPREYKLRLCGTYDPQAGYECYKTMEEFISHELIPSNHGLWFYAHFGGMADLQFLLEALIDRPEFRVNGSFSGASCVICRVKHGRFTWTFVDSFWLLRSSLSVIAKSIGREKTGPTDGMSDAERREWYATVPFETLREYNRNDCEVLWHAIARAQDAILDLGGQLQMTLASTAMQLFRRRYLMEDVDTSTRVNETAHKSYFASRVEVFQKDVNYPGLYYDVNSSFPHAMTFPMPGHLRASYARIPDFVWSDYPFIADVDFVVPDLYLPPIPLRLSNRVFFPVGRWRSWLTGIDLRLLVQEGGRILRVRECKVFEPFLDLAEYSYDLYKRRAATTDPFEREFYKLLLNSLYGKFAEQPMKTTLLINPSVIQLQSLDRGSSELMPGVFFKNREVPIPHAHVPISAYITSIARRTLFQFLAQALEIHYCDTDGFSTTDEFPTSSGLGNLKLEKRFSSATFLVPKLYRWQPSDGSAAIVKAKGFSLSRNAATASEQFETLVIGGEIEIERMVRIRENFRNRTVTPQDKIFRKGLRQIDFLCGVYSLDALPKRFMYPDGHTRAWSYTELTGKNPRKL